MARRSVLFTPGDRQAMLYKAPDAGADVIVFDLEDAVAPGRKADARETVREVLVDPDFEPDSEVCVRVNVDPDLAMRDVETLSGASESLRLDSLMCPKAGSASDVERLVDWLDAAGESLPILALIESARGVLKAPEIAAVPKTSALVFGAEDFAADVGATRTADGDEVLYARERVVVAAAAHGCDAIDTLYTDFEDLDGLSEDTAVSVQLGFDGKLAIHPRQVGPINEAYTPDASARTWADRVLAAKREADAEGRGVFDVDGEMIDAPLIAQAERIRERAEAAGLDE